MRIPCPHCGERDVREFLYLGDASVRRPDTTDLTPDLTAGLAADNATAALVDYVYYRGNPAGPHREYWYHAGGCQCWIVVTRDTRTHAVLGAEAPAPHEAAAP